MIPVMEIASPYHEFHEEYIVCVRGRAKGHFSRRSRRRSLQCTFDRYVGSAEKGNPCKWTAYVVERWRPCARQENRPSLRNIFFRLPFRLPWSCLRPQGDTIMFEELFTRCEAIVRHVACNRCASSSTSTWARWLLCKRPAKGVIDVVRGRALGMSRGPRRRGRDESAAGLRRRRAIVPWATR